MEPIIAFLTSAAGFIFIFGIVVLVHEAGHFFAAKLTGVYAPRFSIGFGPGPKKRWGETQYQIGIIPLGGYVRMASREDEATAFLEGGSEVTAEAEAQAAVVKPKDWDPEAMVPFGPRPVPENRWFESKSLPARLFILMAGVTMNAVLTVFVLFCLNWMVGQTVIETRVVGGVHRAPVTEPLLSQLVPGDTIISVQGTPVANWNDVEKQLIFAGGDTLDIATHRGIVRAPAGPPAGRVRAELRDAIAPYGQATIKGLTADKPAARGGLRAGDVVVAIDGAKVHSTMEMIQRVSVAADRDVQVTVLRDGSTVEATVRPELVSTVDSATGQTVEVGRIGIELQAAFDISHSKVAPPQAMVLAVTQTREMVSSILTTLQGLIQRKVSFKELGGPVAIAKASGEAAQRGLVPLFFLLALLSINLAVLNLLPIPVLDGGQILIVIAESVKGSPFSPKARQVILGTGVALVLLLMLAVSYNDVRRLFGG